MPKSLKKLSPVTSRKSLAEQCPRLPTESPKAHDHLLRWIALGQPDLGTYASRMMSAVCERDFGYKTASYARAEVEHWSKAFDWFARAEPFAKDVALPFRVEAFIPPSLLDRVDIARTWARVDALLERHPDETAPERDALIAFVLLEGRDDLVDLDLPARRMHELDWLKRAQATAVFLSAARAPNVDGWQCLYGTLERLAFAARAATLAAS